MIDNFQKEALNLKLLQITKDDIKLMTPITAPDIFERGTHHFHPEGLYSTEIFGQVGSKERGTTFSYIDLKNEILHPLIVDALNDLKKNLYLGIMAGTVKAIWSDEEKNFIKSDTDEAQTGFEFFMQHRKLIEHKQTGSDERAIKIELLNRYEAESEMRYHLVMPASYRDMEIKNDTQRVDNEINDLYRRLISATNVMISAQDKAPYDVPRWTVQRTAREIHETIMRILKGKSGAMQKKYGRRTTRNSTRNVVTAMDPSSKYLMDPKNPTLKDTKISFIQTLFGALPFTLRGLKHGILEDIFPTGLEGDDVWLVNPKTLKRELHELDADTVDKYATTNGRKKLLTRFFNKRLRNKPVMVNGQYIALVYEDEKTFKIFTDIDELPKGYDKKKVSPLTLGDLLYTSCYPEYDEKYGTMTRYPITEDGSVFPTRYIVTTTVKTFTKQELDENWEPKATFHNFPDRHIDAIWLNALSPHLSRLDGSGGDFDGDQYTSPFLLIKDSVEEIKHYYNTRKAYTRLDGTFLASAGNKSNGLIAFNLTRDMRYSRHEEEQDFDYFN